MNSGAEFFGAGEASESYDPAAFERFKEQMQKNGQFIAAQQKAEQRQKQKEDKLLKILMQFFQSHQNQGMVLLAVRLLEQNIPATFVLHIIILGNQELKRQTYEVLHLEAGNQETTTHEKESSKPEGRWLIPTFADTTLPLRVKAEIDEWSKGLIEAGRGNPFRLLNTALEKDGNVKKIVIDCTANVLQAFVEESGLSNMSYDTTFAFCELLIQGILQNLKKEMEEQKLLGGESEF